MCGWFFNAISGVANYYLTFRNFHTGCLFLFSITSVACEDAVSLVETIEVSKPASAVSSPTASVTDSGKARSIDMQLPEKN